MKSGVGIMIGLKVCVLAVAVMAATAAAARDSWTVEVEGRPVRLERQETFTHPKDAPPYVDERKGGWYQYGRFTLRNPVEVRVRSTRSLAALKVSPAKDWVQAFDFLKEAKDRKLPITKLITHKYPLDKMNEAMEMNISMKGLKIAYVAK